MPRDDERLTRLAQYLGRPLPADENSATTEQPARREFARTSQSSLSGPTAGGSAKHGAVRRASLEEAAPGYAVRVPERGSAYKVITPAPEGTEGNLLRAGFAAAFASPDTPLQQRLHARCGVTAFPEDVLFFDVESTGLGQTPLFLIGVMSWEQDNLVIRQFLARDCREEAAIIQLFVEMAAAKSLFITFNGKSFDLPMVYQRAEIHSISCVLHAHHFDLLHESRRIWRTQLDNCQLQTLEQHICDYPPRSDDIPSEKVPAAYEAFLRNGNALPIAQIMRHNVLDLLVMAALLTKLPPLE